MFGEKIDYWLLRPLAHSANRATEEELDEQAKDREPADAVAAQRRLEKLLTRFEGNFRIDPTATYLDVGCGYGDLTVTLMRAGAKNVTGVDIVERHIEGARASTQAAGEVFRPNFICADINAWRPDALYDVVISNEALEHIAQPDQFIQNLPHLVKPDGVVLLAFGPMFHSAVGDHLLEFFRFQVPWRGVLFSEKALMRLRREFFRPNDPAERLQDMVAGLNLMRFSEFMAYVNKAGFDMPFLSINPQLKVIPPLHWISECLRRIVVIQDYFVVSVYAMLKRS
jgi:SAM-dependent methyltransferase